MQNIYKETMKTIINKMAEFLCKRLELSPGFEIEDTVRRLGGTIEFQELEDTIDAQILSTADNNFKIICEKDSKNDVYLRFAIAHELGHLFLHMTQKNESGTYDIVGSYTHQMLSNSMIEWEAEEFAAAFLMPEDKFREKVEEVESSDAIKDKIQWLAEVFLVPYKSVITRGKSLDIW